MKLNSQFLKELLTAGLFWGVIIGCQQSTPIAASCLIDQKNISYLAFVCFSFLIVLASFFTVLFFLALFLFLNLKQKFHPCSLIVNKLSPHFLGGTVCFFLFFQLIVNWRFAIVKESSILIIALLLISLIISFLLLALFYGGVRFLTKKRTTIVKRLVLFYQAGPGLLFLLSCFFLLINGGIRIKKGPVGFKLVKEQKNTEQLTTATNVLIITVDALRKDHFSQQTMPNLYSLAQKGIVFDNAYTPAPWTLPSFASFFSAKQPSEIGVSTYENNINKIKLNHKLVDKFVTFPEKMRDKGFLTQAIVSNGYLVRKRGLVQGFEGVVNLDDHRPYHWSFHFNKLPLIRIVTKSHFLKKELKKTYQFFTGYSRDHSYITRAEEIVNLSLQWLQKREKKDPFLLWLHFMDPHGPYDPPVDYLSKTEEIDSNILKIIKNADTQTSQLRWQAKEKEILTDLYRGEVLYCDQQIKRLVDFIERENLLEKTIIVFASDHGEEFFDHCNNVGHGHSLYNELIKTPLFIVLQTKEQKTVKKPVSTIDIGPTLLTLLQLEDNQSRNWLSNDYHQQLLIEANNKGPELKSLIKGDWKIIWDSFNDSLELYYLKTDQEESNNLIDSNLMIVEELKQSLVNKMGENKRLFNSHFQPGFDFLDQLKDVPGY